MCLGVIFDMDGTIADTSRGIYDSYKFVAKEMNYPVPDDMMLNGVIGGPLPKNLMNFLNIPKEQIELAVKTYRNFYSKEGYLESEIYPNITDVFRELYKSKIQICIATLKAEKFAKKLMKIWDLEKYCTCICGVNDSDSISKIDMIQYCIKKMDISANKTILIGDHVNDYECAKSTNIKFLGVTYGFGLSISDCVKLKINYVTKPEDIIDMIDTRV